MGYDNLSEISDNESTVIISYHSGHEKGTIRRSFPIKLC